MSSVREEQLVCDNSDSQGEEDFAIRFGVIVCFGPHGLDLSDGQFSERCDVDGSFFNSDAIPIIFGKA